MRICLVHNFYQQPGGEDQVFAAETALLENHGHEVIHYTAHNDRVESLSQVRLAGATLWNPTAYRELRDLFRARRPQVVHFHNIFPLVSPAGYYAARAEGAAVVQTLHNYRLLCPGTTFFRDDRVCEDCLGRTFPWPGIVHGCYRGSRSASAGVATMVAAHRLLRTWTSAVDLYVALTEFARNKFIEGGVPETKIACKPNFLAVDPGAGEHRGGYALYVGRLTEEKGIRPLLEAWNGVGCGIPLKIVGDGPHATLLEQPAGNVEWLGHRPKPAVMELMKEASFLIFPSQWYETFGLTIIEAFATGLPVIASELGSAAELVSHRRTGLHFRAGDAHDLAAKVAWAVNHSAEMGEMGRRGREVFLERFTAEGNYPAMMALYRRALRQGKFESANAAVQEAEPAVAPRG